MDYENRLQDDIMQFIYDPYDFVMYAYPWQEPGTILEDETGPDQWQTQVLKDLGKALRKQSIVNAGIEKTLSTAIQIAVRSGHGVGKTALISWIIQWFLSTRANPQTIVTANTKEQLTNKTWRELSKWHKLLINGHWFKWTATKFYMVADPSTWFASAVPWSADRSEAFAGTHETHVMVIFDEASAIDDIIWEVAEGAKTTENVIFIVFGNPTRNTGRFTQCFKPPFSSQWLTYEIDARTAKKANKEQIQQWIDNYDLDSDFVRVRVLGKEPRAGSMQLIPGDIVSRARMRVVHPSIYSHAAKILAVDVARFGDDKSCMIKRQGLAAWDLKKWRGIDTMLLASLTAQEIDDWQPDAVFIDVIGIGAGVVDRLRQLGYDVIEVVAGAKSGSPRYRNKRAECWYKMLKWFETEAVCIPDDQELDDDLTGIEYGFNDAEQVVLERKQDMKKRGLPSPDCGDVLAYTFYMPVHREFDRRNDRDRRKIQAVTEYNVLEYSVG